MKRISTLLITLLVVASAHAQTIYTIDKDKKWSSAIPTNCTDCIININPGVTLTIDKSVTLTNVTINGGKLTITGNNKLTLQVGGKGRNEFNNVIMDMNGNSGLVITGATAFNNSEFNLKGSTDINVNGLPCELELSGTRINLNGSTNFTATQGMVVLKDNSQLVAGDGSNGSHAYVHFSNTANLEIHDGSALVLSGSKNYYYNMSPYVGADNKEIATANNNYNCGANNKPCVPGYVYGPYSLLSSFVNTLPVVLNDFTAALHNNQVQLNWATDQESNSSRFEIERSKDGASWTKIGTVTAQGNTSVKTKYAYTDRAPEAGVNYYRLKMVDLDNSFEYSQVKSVRIAFATNVNIYPNPAAKEVHVSVPVATNLVRLMNTAGQVLQERKSVAARTTVSFDVSSYAGGTYMIQILQADGSAQNGLLLIAK